MDARARFWESVDDALAAVGFFIVLGQPALVVSGAVGGPVVAWWGGLVVASAAAGTAYRRRGHDVGDLGSFIFATTVSLIVIGLAGGALVALTGLDVPDGYVQIALGGGAYGVAYWYAYRGGRRLLRGQAG
ncbi:hypothetical protein [Halomicrobium salinisoli]|uniref:hypothetical protein n=1 Tax=Halomicrobium salinisoli TaxID=2878391 RepID=UPI001CF08741|nr:hypothetical protein [Halomicrobium salinisoli]